MANRVITKIQEKQPAAAAKTTPSRNIYVQTTPMECDACVERQNMVRLSQAIQTEAPKMVSVKVQTNKENFTEPLLNSLKSMSAAQLVAMTDFAHIICDPRPSNSEEIFKLREQLMDVYNLSQRDDEAVRLAERDRLNSVRNLLSTNRRTDVISPSMVITVDTNRSSPGKRIAHQASGSSDAMIRDAEIELGLANEPADFRHTQPVRPKWTANQPTDMNHMNWNSGNCPPGDRVFSRRGGIQWRGRGRGSRGGNMFF